jgi:septation ring formation regulator EzrA
MNIDNITLEKHLKKFSITNNVVSIIVALGTALSVGYGFYYKTTGTLETHSKEINEIKMSVDELSVSVGNSAIFQGASKEQIKALENQVADVKKTQDRIEDKIDKLIMRER